METDNHNDTGMAGSSSSVAASKSKEIGKERRDPALSAISYRPIDARNGARVFLEAEGKELLEDAKGLGHLNPAQECKLLGE